LGKGLHKSIRRRTVQKRLERTYVKLGVETRTAATIVALETLSTPTLKHLLDMRREHLTPARLQVALMLRHGRGLIGIGQSEDAEH
jgi:hypothetical protein